MKELYLIGGVSILSVTSCDFFFTTLSASGAGFVTRAVAASAHQAQLMLSRLFGKVVLSISGLVVNLAILSVWVVLFWAGLFLIYSYDPEFIVDSNGFPANTTERLYFTGYTLSTLGIGDFKPVSTAYKVVTSIFSFFGFIFFTTSMTYLVSVASAIIRKRSLAMAIRDLGTHPAEVIQTLTNLDHSYSYQQLITIQQMIERHVISHQAYPVIHYYDNRDRSSALSVNISVLDEAMSILLSNNKHPLFHEIKPLRNSLDQFFRHIEDKYGSLVEVDDVPEITWQRQGIPKGIIPTEQVSAEVKSRRRVLGGLLKSEGFTWADVYLGNEDFLNQ